MVSLEGLLRGPSQRYLRDVLLRRAGANGNACEKISIETTATLPAFEYFLTRLRIEAFRVVDCHLSSLLSAGSSKMSLMTLIKLPKILGVLDVIFARPTIAKLVAVMPVSECLASFPRLLSLSAVKMSSAPVMCALFDRSCDIGVPRNHLCGLLSYVGVGCRWIGVYDAFGYFTSKLE